MAAEDLSNANCGIAGEATSAQVNKLLIQPERLSSSYGLRRDGTNT